MLPLELAAFYNEYDRCGFQQISRIGAAGAPASRSAGIATDDRLERQNTIFAH